MDSKSQYYNVPLPLLPRSHLPPTPDSPSLPTILPLVSEPIEQLTSLDGLVDYKTASYSSYPAVSDSAPASLLTGLNVLTATRDALDYLHHIYTSDSSVQESFTFSVSLIAQTIRRNGRLMVCGVGKSGKIAHKFVATCNSMRIRASILDPTDALHGDLGGISEVSKMIGSVRFVYHVNELSERYYRPSHSIIQYTGTSDVASASYSVSSNPFDCKTSYSFGSKSSYPSPTQSSYCCANTLEKTF